MLVAEPGIQDFGALVSLSRNTNAHYNKHEHINANMNRSLNMKATINGNCSRSISVNTNEDTHTNMKTKTLFDIVSIVSVSTYFAHKSNSRRVLQNKHKYQQMYKHKKFKNKQVRITTIVILNTKRIQMQIWEYHWNNM